LPLYLFYFDSETISDVGGLRVLMATTGKKVVNFFEERSEKAHPQTPGNLAWGFSDLEMTWLLYCADVCTWWPASRP